MRVFRAQLQSIAAGDREVVIASRYKGRKSGASGARQEANRNEIGDGGAACRLAVDAPWARV